MFSTPRGINFQNIKLILSLETDYEEIVTGNIRDLLSLRDSTNSNFTFSELKEMISFLGSSRRIYVHK